MAKWIQHQVGDMHSMTQHCILCGELINDYRNAMYETSFGPPQGFAAGAIYITGTFPIVTPI